MVKTLHCSLSSQPGRGDQLNLICPAALLNEQSQRGTGAVGGVRLEKNRGILLSLQNDREILQAELPGTS